MANLIVVSPKRGRRTFAFRRWVDGLRSALAQGLSSHELALAISLGAACAFFPILGTATPLCLLVGMALRLNQPLIQAVNGLTAPLYPPLVYLFIRTGEWATQSPARPLNLAAMSQSLRADPQEFLRRFGVTLGHAVLGWGLIVLVGVPFVYLIARLVIHLRTNLLAGRRAAGSRVIA